MVDKKMLDKIWWTKYGGLNMVDKIHCSGTNDSIVLSFMNVQIPTDFKMYFLLIEFHLINIQSNLIFYLL